MASSTVKSIGGHVEAMNKAYVAGVICGDKFLSAMINAEGVLNKMVGNDKLDEHTRHEAEVVLNKVRAVIPDVQVNMIEAKATFAMCITGCLLAMFVYLISK